MPPLQRRVHYPAPGHGEPHTFPRASELAGEGRPPRSPAPSASRRRSRFMAKRRRGGSGARVSSTGKRQAMPVPGTLWTVSRRRPSPGVPSSRRHDALFHASPASFRPSASRPRRAAGGVGHRCDPARAATGRRAGDLATCAESESKRDGPVGATRLRTSPPARTTFASPAPHARHPSDLVGAPN